MLIYDFLNDLVGKTELTSPAEFAVLVTALSFGVKRLGRCAGRSGEVSIYQHFW